MLLKNAKTLSQIKNVGFTFDDREKCRPFERSVSGQAELWGEIFCPGVLLSSLILNCRNFLVEYIEMWWQRSFINCDFFALVGITLFYLNYALAWADLWLRHTCCLEMIDFCVWCVMLSCGERWAGDMQQMTRAGKGEVRHRRLRSWRQVYRGGVC